jgi:hypothetical protein
VASISKTILKKILTGSTRPQINVILKNTDQLARRGVKARFLALNSLIDYIEPQSYINENPGMMREMMESSKQTATSGKYVINFFESLLKKAWHSYSETGNQFFKTYNPFNV